MGKLGREALSPQELTSFQDSISSLAASQRDIAGDLSSDANALLQLLSQTADDSTVESSQGTHHYVLVSNGSSLESVFSLTSYCASSSL